MELCEQYGTSCADTVNLLPRSLPAAAELIVGSVVNAQPDPRRPGVNLANGLELEYSLVVLTSAGNNKLLGALGSRPRAVSCRHSLTFGFDIGPLGGMALNHRGFNYHSRAGAHVDYLAPFPIGDRVRANLFKRLGVKPGAVARRKTDSVTMLAELFPGRGP